jgi:hypothetical protein
MKRLLPLLIFLLICSFAQTSSARMNAYIAGSVASTATANHCDSTSDSDVLCEDSESTTNCGNEAADDSVCRNTWTVLEASGSSVVFDASHSGTLSCTDKGSRAIQITKTETNAKNGIIIAKTAVDTTFVQFYLNVVAENANAGEVYIAGILDGSGNGVMQLRMTGKAANPTLRLLYWNGTGWGVGAESSALTVGTWYRIRMQYAASTDTNGIVKLYVDDAEVTSISNNGSTQQAGKYYWGNYNGGDTDTYTIQIDNIKIDDDTEPGACSK